MDPPSFRPRVGASEKPSVSPTKLLPKGWVGEKVRTNKYSLCYSITNFVPNSRADDLGFERQQLCWNAPLVHLHSYSLIVNS